MVSYRRDKAKGRWFRVIFGLTPRPGICSVACCTRSSWQDDTTGFPSALHNCQLTHVFRHLLIRVRHIILCVCMLDSAMMAKPPLWLLLPVIHRGCLGVKETCSPALGYVSKTIECALPGSSKVDAKRKAEESRKIMARPSSCPEDRSETPGRCQLLTLLLVFDAHR